MSELPLNIENLVNTEISLIVAEKSRAKLVPIHRDLKALERFIHSVEAARDSVSRVLNDCIMKSSTLKRNLLNTPGEWFKDMTNVNAIRFGKEVAVTETHIVSLCVLRIRDDNKHTRFIVGLYEKRIDGLTWNNVQKEQYSYMDDTTIQYIEEKTRPAFLIREILQSIIR